LSAFADSPAGKFAPYSFRNAIRDTGPIACSRKAALPAVVFADNPSSIYKIRRRNQPVGRHFFHFTTRQSHHDSKAMMMQ
jgi:hypothetical protein